LEVSDLEGLVALFRFEFVESFSHGCELISHDGVVFGDLLEEEFLSTKDGREERDLDG
jgi:hypothetical protein